MRRQMFIITLVIKERILFINLFGTCIAKNNVGFDTNNNVFVGSFDGSSDYNCSSDTS